uniref:Flocculation protein FLO11-like n=1 Tax=Angiostrongylus cantonensis TaxID=6313 RepID=A0A0K0CU37_ANGCA
MMNQLSVKILPKIEKKLNLRFRKSPYSTAIEESPFKKSYRHRHNRQDDTYKAENTTTPDVKKPQWEKEGTTPAAEKPQWEAEDSTTTATTTTKEPLLDAEGLDSEDGNIEAGKTTAETQEDRETYPVPPSLPSSPTLSSIATTTITAAETITTAETTTETPTTRIREPLVDNPDAEDTTRRDKEEDLDSKEDVASILALWV